MSVQMTPDQAQALEEITAAFARGERHLLVGEAGCGKTWLMQKVAKVFHAKGRSVVASAPTHKAVAVLSRKLKEGGLDYVRCRTIHSLLSLAPKTVADRQVFARKPKAEPVMDDVVIIDECSMLSADLMKHIRRYLPMSFVLFVGDPAQLPPVGEDVSEAFDTKGRSALTTIVRQGEGNPILEAAGIVRRSQGGPMDWSWVKSAKVPPLGVYRPSDASEWMRKAFTSPEFDADPDTFRYLCWTNDRVAEVNRQVRQWRYGDNLPTPFMPGERILLRQPLIRERSIIFNTNDEVDLLQIERGTFPFAAASTERLEAWTAEIPSWVLTMRRPGDEDAIEAHMIDDARAYNSVEARLRDEAADDRNRWRELAHFKEQLIKAQSCYALTCHNSQGSTLKTCFIDLPNIRRRADTNPLECQRMLYVALTRASHSVALVGA